MKNKKHLIQVRSKGTNKVVNIIKRVITTEAVGNFCPSYVRYGNKMHLVKSDAGDLSDPFRADSSYLNSLFIEE